MNVCLIRILFDSTSYEVLVESTLALAMLFKLVAERVFEISCGAPINSKWTSSFGICDHSHPYLGPLSFNQYHPASTSISSAIPKPWEDVPGAATTG